MKQPETHMSDRRQIRITKPKPARPTPPLDTRTPSGRVLPY
jgi:hypothetical protein